jgi:hypothetical protein
MVRLRQRDLKPYTVKNRIPVKDADGTTFEDWDRRGFTIRANIKPAGGKLAAETYGERLAYMLTALIEGDTTLNEGVGICVYVDPSEKPDYKVVASPQWSSHSIVMLEAIR